MDKLWDVNAFSMNKEEKEGFYKEKLKELTLLHSEKCKYYGRMLKNFRFSPEGNYNVCEYPFLPVRLFKELELKSVADDEVVKTMTSSGTTGQAVSKIYLDKETSANQTKALVKITSEFLGKKRLPMLITDSKKVVTDRRLFSARGAGILGFSILGAHPTYALNEDMELDVPVIEEFLEKYKNQDILLFGFTYIIWQHFYKELVIMKNSRQKP